MEPDRARALTFGSRAEEYDRWRPTYPEEAVSWLAPDPPGYVADVGAGTGQLTGSLLERGLRVASVEPDPDMLAVLARNFPSAEPHLAKADSLPLPARAVDAVLVATAFHWLPFDETVAEVRRVLKPGGWLGLVYNVAVPATEWERGLVATNPDHKGEAAKRPQPSWAFPGGCVETAWFPWNWHVTPEHYRNNLATNSAVMRLPEADRLRRLDAAESLVRQGCDESGSLAAPVHLEAFCLKWTYP